MPDRRKFLAQAAALAVAPSALAHAAPRPSSHPPAWDLGWLDQLSAAKHKAVFDATMITSGIAMGHVDLYLKNYEELYGVPEKDMRAVLVIRHEAVPMILNDAFWQKYQLGTKLRLNDPDTGVATTRNYFASAGARPVAELTTLEQLKSRGVIILGCN